MEGAEKSGKLAPAQIKLPHWSLSISGRHTCERGEFRLRFMVPLGRVKPLGRVIKDSSVNYFVHKKVGLTLGDQIHGYDDNAIIDLGK